MKEKKNIERLFQEKFKDFEVIPPQEAWQNIEARLQDKKKKRRVFPIWLQPTGIAASIVIVLGVFNIFNNDNSFIENQDLNNINNNSVVNQSEIKSNNSNENTFPSTSKDKVNSNEGLNKIIEEGEIVTEQNKKESISKTKKLDIKSNSKNIFENKQGQYVFENNRKNNNKTHTKQSYSNSYKDLISNQHDEIENNSANKNKNSIVASNNQDTPSKSKNSGSAEIENNVGIDYNKSITDDLIPNKSNNDFLVDNNTEKGNNINQVLIDTLKINQVLVNNEILLDSTPIVVENSEENELEKLLKEKEEGKNADEKEKEEKRNRWVVSTNVAPVYFNSFSKGSPLDEEFVSNDKSYQTSISYGVGAEYNLSKKIALRSGINSFNLSYNVNDVVFYQDVNARQLKNVETNEMGRMISVQSELKNELNEVTTSGNLVSKFEGELNQQLNYIEVPLELSYKLVDNKIGINLIGGMSTLFLQDNSVSLKSNGVDMKIGEAKNLNDVHFSGNFGLGFRYTFWKSFNANFQPMLKYQFNTFSENSGNFKPYIVGLYTGLSYSF